MTKEKIIDIASLHREEIDEITTSYQVRWDNTLLVTAYDDEATFILTTEGEKIVLQKRLKEVLARFAQENAIPNYQMGVLYEQVDCKTRGYIAGHHRLVPTCGVTNKQVVYYMVHHLEYAEALADDQGTMLVFNSHRRRCKVRLDSPEKTFRRIVDAADRVAKIQLKIHEYCRYQYGKVDYEKQEERTYNSDYCVIQSCQKMSINIMEETILWIIRNAYYAAYGEEIDPVFLSYIKKVINKF